MNTLRALGALAALTMAAFSANAVAPKGAPRSGYVEATGIKYYYEISGKGEPLLLLHGGLGSTDMFKAIMPAFTSKQQHSGRGARCTLCILAGQLDDSDDDRAAAL